MRFAFIALAVIAGPLLAGCGEQVLSMTPATSVAECQAQYEAAKNRPDYSPSGRDPTSRAIMRGILEGAYNQCVTRVGGTLSASPEAVLIVDAPQETGASAVSVVSSSTCLPGGAVMQGGVGYCVQR